MPRLDGVQYAVGEGWVMEAEYCEMPPGWELGYGSLHASDDLTIYVETAWPFKDRQQWNEYDYGISCVTNYCLLCMRMRVVTAVILLVRRYLSKTRECLILAI